jgi:hypothetical protein
MAETVLDAIRSEAYLAWQRRTNRCAIDATPDAYLDYCAIAFPVAGRHHDLAEAVSLLKPAQMRPGALIVGHGAPGRLVVGAGRSLDFPTRRLRDDEAWRWGPMTAPLSGRCRRLTLLGCNVGAGVRGIELLRQLACHLDATVTAPTGIVFSMADGSLRLQEGSVWQKVRCDDVPDPIEQPMLSRLRKRLYTSAGALEPPTGEPMAPFATGNVVMVAFEPTDDEHVARAFDGPLAAELMREVDPHPLIVRGGAPGGLVWGRVVVQTAAPAADGSEHFAYTLWSGSLLQDEQRPDRFFAASARFAAQIEPVDGDATEPGPPATA